MPEPDVPPPRRGIPLAAVVVAAVVVLGSGAIALADLAPAAPIGGAAAGYLPADGTAALLRDADGSDSVVETTRELGPTLLFELPPLVTDQQLTELGDAVSGVHLWRRTITPVAGDEPTTSVLARLDERGVALLAITGTASGLSFAPALPVLPADVAAGSRWSAAGDALPGGAARYRLDASAAAVDGSADGCLAVTLQLELSADGVAPQSATQVDTWCPGAGVVATRSAGPDGATTVDESSRPVAVGEEPTGGLADLAAALTTDPADRDWRSAEGWGSTRVAFGISDPVFGDGAYPGVADPIAVAAGELVAVAAGSELLGYRPAAGGAVRAWVARPGGGVVALAAAGEGILVTTTDRTLVAYAPNGARLWARELPEVAVAAPAADGAGGAVVATLDGTVQHIDLATGATGWSLATPGEIDAAPALAQGLAFVVDRGGTVRAIDSATGVERWAVALPQAARVALGGGIIAVQGDGGDVWVLDPADGLVLWQRVQFGVARGLVVVGGVVVAQTDERTGAWRLDDAARLWEAPATGGLLTDGRRLVLVDLDGVRVATPEGELLVEAPLRADTGGVSLVPVALPDRVWVVTTNLEGTEVGP